MTEKQNHFSKNQRALVLAAFLVGGFLVLAGVAEWVIQPRNARAEPLLTLSEISRFDVAAYEFSFEIVTAARQVERNVTLLIFSGGLLGSDEKRVLLRFRIQVKYGTSLLEEEGAQYTIGPERIGVRLPRLRVIGQPAIESEILDAEGCSTEEMHRIRDAAREEMARGIETLIRKFGLHQSARDWTSRVVSLILSLPFPGKRVDVSFREET